MIPHLYRNPYIVGSAVTKSNFYGYEDIVSKILAYPQHITHLLGMRRIGKSSILLQIASKVEGLYLDLLRTGGDWARFKRLIVTKAAEIPWLSSPQQLEKSEDACEAIEILNDLAARNHRELLLAFDETEVLIQLGKSNPNALQMLQSLLGSSTTHLRFVFASAKQLTDLDDLSTKFGYGSPFLNSFPPPTYILGIRYQDVIHLICQTNGMTPINGVSDKVIGEIAELASNHPYFIQWICHRLYEINPKPTEWQIDEQILHPDPNLHRILKTDFEYLSAPEREIMQRVLQKKDLSDMNPIFVQGLLQLGYLRKTTDGLDVRNYFFRQWLQNQSTNFWQASSSISEEATLRLYTKESKTMLDPVTATMATAIVEKTTEFLFGQATELLKEWRTKRKDKPMVEHPVETVQESSFAITGDVQTMKQVVNARVKQLLDTTQTTYVEIYTQEAEGALKQTENLRRTRLQYEEAASKPLTINEKIQVQSQIDELDTKIAEKSERLRQILETLAQRKIHVPALDD